MMTSENLNKQTECTVCVHLWSNVAQVERVRHGFLTPLVIGCSSQVASIEATRPVVGIGGSVELVHTGK